MHFARAYRWAMTPAARTLLVVAPTNSSLNRIRVSRFQAEGTYHHYLFEERFLSLPRMNQVPNGNVIDHGGFQRITNQLLAARFFDFPINNSTHLQGFGHLIVCSRIVVRWIWKGKFLHVNRRCSRGR
jgi:hypothetical protein